MASRSFKLYEISGDLTKIDLKIFDDIKQNITDFGLVNEEPDRYGFDFIKSHDDYIYGVFVQEYEQFGIDYDDESKRKQIKSSPFEHYVFIIILNNSEGIIALEQKRITGQKGLMGKTSDNFEDTIIELFKTSFQYFKSLKPFVHKFSKDELIKYFDESNVIELKVNNLRYKTVPEDLIFFNPNFDKNEFERSKWDDDFKYIDEEVITGENLQTTKVGKAAINTGDTKSITMQEGGDIITIQSEIGPIIHDLKIENYDDKEHLNVERTVEFLKTRRLNLTNDEYQLRLEEF